MTTSNIEHRTSNAPIKNRGLLFVVSAPSGAGKTSLCRELIDRLENLRHSVSFTTRGMRDGEIEGVDYHFVDKPTFKRMIEQDQLAEWAEVHGNHYGTSLQTLQLATDEGVDLLLDIDCQGAAQLKSNYPGGVFIFILPPSYSELERRLRGRETDSDDVIERRLRNSELEIAEANKYDYLVVNDDFDVALEQLCAIIIAEHCRTERMQSRLNIT